MTYDRFTPQPLPRSLYPTSLPTVEVVALEGFFCLTCHGRGTGSGAPCETCGGTGGVPPGSTLHVDVGASWHWQYDDPAHQILIAVVGARLRSPWPGFDAWDAMSRAHEMQYVWGPRSLELHVLRTAKRACEGMSDGNPFGRRVPGLEIQSCRLTAPVVWPEGWPTPPRRVIPGSAEIADERRARLDLAVHEIERW